MSSQLPRVGSFLTVKVGDTVAVADLGKPAPRGVLEEISACRNFGYVRLGPAWRHRCELRNVTRLRLDDADRAELRASAFGALA